MQGQPFAGAARELTEQLIDLVSALSALRDISSVDARLVQNRELAAYALEALAKAQAFERCSIFLLDGEILTNISGRDVIEAARGESGASPVTFRLGEGLMGLAAATRALQHCRDTSRDPRYKPRPPPRGEEESPRALISAPILEGDAVLGVLNISHPVPGYFNEWHERLVLVFSSVLGQLLANNRLLHAMEVQVRSRTQQLEAALADAERLRERFEQLSVVDDLTGLHNRRFFFPAAQTALVRAMRSNQALSIVVLDLDRFKGINDRHGHAAGDRVLQEVAECLRRQVRDGDILARFGGEEFILALPDTDVAGAGQLVARLQAALAESPVVWEGVKITVTSSAGIAHHEGRTSVSPGALLERLIADADGALYESKARGGGAVTVAAPRPVHTD